MRLPNLASEMNCTGCTACKSICPTSAIDMVEGSEGFLLPIINKTKCVGCLRCENTCPVINVKQVDSKHNFKAYVIQNLDLDVRKQSTSGGAFSMIASYVLKKGGVVFGAYLDKDFVVKHCYVNNENDLSLFRNSKYVQSNLLDTFRQVKEFLSNGVTVLFSGTPCQVVGLKSFLPKSLLDSLITIDFICHAVPSPLIFQKYIEYMKQKYDFDKVVFRDKRFGYSLSVLSLYKGNNLVYYASSDKDQYMRLFLNDYSSRRSCYHCCSQPFAHLSDFTLWDSWNPSEAAKIKINNRFGTTNMIAWTSKADDLLEQTRHLSFIKQVELNDIYDGERKHVLKLKDDRISFLKMHICWIATLFLVNMFLLRLKSKLKVLLDSSCIKYICTNS